MMRTLLLGVASMLLACGGATAAARSVASQPRCYVSYDGLVWRARGPQAFIPVGDGRARCDAPEWQRHVQPAVFSNLRGGSACRVSFDGLFWYRVPAGDFAPIAATQARCDGPGKLTRLFSTPVPSWARPRGPTRAIFAIASLQETYAAFGMRRLGELAHAAKFPVTWLVGDPLWLFLQRDRYQRWHRDYGDDVQTAPEAGLVTLARTTLPWSVPHVAVDSGGRVRDIERDRILGDRAFWGIAWNSHGVDGIADRGAPWGAYCADARAYKQPSRSGDCDTIALEWTSRDLTATFWSDREDIYSTDPDDLTVRGGFAAGPAAEYARAMVDAYAAAGASEPLVVVAQQESAEMENGALDVPILRALYAKPGARGCTARPCRTLPLRRASLPPRHGP